MTSTCVICGMRLENDDDLACSERCSREFDRRREAAKSKLRETLATKNKHRGKYTMGEIANIIMRAAARVILEKDVPQYASGAELDKLICDVDPALRDMTPCFRRSQITRNINRVHYAQRSHSGRGKPTFILVGDKEVVRRELEQIAHAGMRV